MVPVNEVFLCLLLHVNSTGEVRERRHIAFPGMGEGHLPRAREDSGMCVESPLQVSWELVSMR